LRLDPENFTVDRDGKAITLTSKEFALLEYFMRNCDRIVTKDTVVQNVWNYDANILPNTVEVYVGYLRNKVDKTFKTKLIHTRRGFGYYFGEQG
jgi:DNA-binding response OmpR family regulator